MPRISGLLVVLCCVVGKGGKCQNPIAPPGCYFADPSAKVFGGRLYLFGSLDESCDYYCSHRHHVLHTGDMRTWTLDTGAFRSSGARDGVPYNDKVLYAPDAAERNGKYYLYYCQPDRDHAEGVAIGTSPTGPFSNGQAMALGGFEQIDPSVFVDEDGQAYYLWGQFTLKMARLDTSMTQLVPGSITDSVLTEADHHFHEGAYMTKRNGIYYLVFADMVRGDAPTCIGYATATSPMGPYTYGGVIVDNNYSNPGNWNNHGSIAELGGQWYVFYHRSTHGCKTMRTACVEPIRFLTDGSIPEVEMTSQGAQGPLSAFAPIEAEWACILNGNARIEQQDSACGVLTAIGSGDKAAYKYIDFGAGADSVTLHLKPGEKGGKLILSEDKPWHRRLARIDVAPAEKDKCTTITAKIERAVGVHALWLHFYGDDGQMFTLDRFVFH
jgi:arabinoxylan arabinofuranohydrolase